MNSFPDTKVSPFTKDCHRGLSIVFISRYMARLPDLPFDARKVTSRNFFSLKNLIIILERMKLNSQSRPHSVSYPMVNGFSRGFLSVVFVPLLRIFIERKLEQIKMKYLRIFLLLR